jgi:hypothetical protein
MILIINMLLTMNLENINNDNVILLSGAFDGDCLNYNNFERWFNIFRFVISRFLYGVVAIIIFSIIIFVIIEIPYISSSYFHSWRYKDIAKQLTDDQIVHILTSSVSLYDDIMLKFNESIKDFLSKKEDLSRKIRSTFNCGEGNEYLFVENLGNLNLYLYIDNDKLIDHNRYQVTKNVICEFVRQLDPFEFSRIIECYYRVLASIECYYYSSSSRHSVKDSDFKLGSDCYENYYIIKKLDQYGFYKYLN